MEQLLTIVKRHLLEYPMLKPQDLVKLIYQNEFGPGHLVKDSDYSEQMLIEEFHNLNYKLSHSRIEQIGNGLVRIYLFDLSEKFLKALNLMFVKTAEKYQITTDSKQQKIQEYQKKLDLMVEHYNELSCSFSKAELKDYLHIHEAAGYPMVRHSEQYRAYYHPAYRVIDERYAPYLELAAQILEQGKSEKQNSRLIVGIDGNAAAGKSTMAAVLSELFDAEVIHVDDFFLPLELRTQSRFEKPGENVHYERFIEEVATPLRHKEKTFSYRRFSCKKMDYDDSVKIDGMKMVIIEGAYAMRPEYIDLYDIKVFLQIDEEQQMNRIINRNGKEMSENFKLKWIPMEHEYFEFFHIKDKCDFVYQTNEHLI